MGKNVNVVLSSSGETKSIPQEDADRLVAARSARYETDQEAQHVAVDSANSGRASGVAQGAKTILESGLDTLSAGIYGKVAGAISPEYGEDMANRGQHRPGMRMIGDAAGFLLPGTGLLGKAGEATLPALAERAGAKVEGVLGSKAAGRVAEGYVQGMGGAVVASNVSGDPLTIEGVLEDGGIAGVLNYGVGKLADKLHGAGTRAQESITKAKGLTADRELLETNRDFLVNNDKYETFKNTHDAAAKSLKQENKAAVREAEDYAEATTPASVKKAIETVKKARLEVQAKAQATEYGQEAVAGQRSAKRASTSYEKDVGAVDKYVNSSKMPKAIGKLQSALDELESVEVKKASNWSKLEGKKARESGGSQGGDFPQGAKDDAGGSFADQVNQAAGKADRFGDRKVYISSLHENMPAASRGTLDEFKAKLLAANKAGDVELTRADLTAAHPSEKLTASETKADGADYHMMVHEPGTGGVADHGIPAKVEAAKAPGTTAERVKDWKDRLSAARRKLGKGWDSSKLEGGRWAPGGAPDAESALDDLNAIRDEMRQGYPTGKAARKLPDDLPRIPKKPEDWKPTPLEVGGDTDHLIGVSRDLGATIEKAQQHMADGRGDLALAEIRAAEGRAKAKGMGDLVFPELPSAPRSPVNVPAVDLPDTLLEFSRKTPAKVDELANAIQGMERQTVDAATGTPVVVNEVGEAFGKIADDLGLERSESIADTVRGVHKALAKYPAALGRVEAEAAKEAAKDAGRSGKGGIFAKIGDTAKRGITYGASRAFDSGGFGGALARTMAGMAVGNMLDGAESAALGGALMAGKAGIRSKITALVAKGTKVASVLHAIGPVTSYLATQFPAGHKDDAPDIRKQAYNRVNDVHQAALMAPDAAFLAVEAAMGTGGDVAYKAHQAVVKAVGYLSQMAPKDPGIDITLSGSNWHPSHEESIEFAHRIEAVVNPMAAIARSVAGDGHPAATEALWAVWPATMSEYAQEFMVSNHRGMTYEAEARMAELLRVSVGLNEPAVIVALQALYLPSPTSNNAPQGANTGRPPAVKSTVAGSSVSQLLA